MGQERARCLGWLSQVATLSPDDGLYSSRRWGRPYPYNLRRTWLRDLGPIPRVAPAPSVDL
ncbi:hypothetical protein GCM10018966_032730 [Streptomyces yanii]